MKPLSTSKEENLKWKEGTRWQLGGWRQLQEPRLKESMVGRDTGDTGAVGECGAASLPA